jgi:hypothetical protein
MPPTIAVALLSSASAFADPPPEPAPVPEPQQAPSPASEPEHVSVVRPRQPPPEPEPVVPTPVESPAERELTAEDVADEPVPGKESGRTDHPPGDSALRYFGRGLLFFPKLAVNLAMSPFRGTVYAIDRYHLPELYDKVFFNDAMTIGLVPTASIDSSYGVVLGARFTHRDLFGDKEGLGLQAAVGSRYRQVYAAELSSGNRFGDRVKLQLDGGYERRPHDAFYGIGNTDTIPAPETPVDPLSDPAVEARYRQARSRVSLMSDVRAVSNLHIRAAGAVSRVNFGPGDNGEEITERYDTSRLPGFDGYSYGYGELELRWDGRHSKAPLEPASVYSAGSLAAVFAGRVHRLDAGPDFNRYGVDLQHFFHLTRGPRVLALRFRGEGVTGRLEDVPFTELPRLGGSTYLRGYSLDRFRDRVAAFGSAVYSWDLSQWFSANVFVDAGRVFPSVEEMSLHDMRVGYGVAIEAHSVNSFVLEGSIASSVDGGLMLSLSFNPIYDIDERVRRR